MAVTIVVAFKSRTALQAAADVVLVSDEYKPDSVGWRLEQREIQAPLIQP